MPRIERSVDLPAPDGPMIEMNSPGCTSKVMRRRTYMRPAGVSNTFSRFRMAMSGPVMGAGSAAASRDCVDEENRPIESSRGARAEPDRAGAGCRKVAVVQWRDNERAVV